MTRNHKRSAFPQSALEGSPPPELPNYASDFEAEMEACKYVLSNKFAVTGNLIFCDVNYTKY